MSAKSPPVRYRVTERLLTWLRRHEWCPTCRNTGTSPPGDPQGLGCWDCWRSGSGPPDDLPEHVGFYVTFNYGDVWECEDDCPGCAAEAPFDPPTLGRTHHTGKVVVRDAPLSYAGDDFVLDANENAPPDRAGADTRTGRPTDPTTPKEGTT